MIQGVWLLGSGGGCSVQEGMVAWFRGVGCLVQEGMAAWFRGVAAWFRGVVAWFRRDGCLLQEVVLGSGGMIA